MSVAVQNKVKETLKELFHDSRNDKLKMIKGAARSLFRPMQPSDFEEAYLSISKEQGEHLSELIVSHGIKNIVEFGTSFGISTLYLAQGVLKTGGQIVTTELLKSKAEKAIANFERAGVNEVIELRIGDAMKTLKGYQQPIDLLLLDGWKNLYLPLFRMLEPGFHSGTIIYVDNANMSDSQAFLRAIASNNKYNFESMFGGSVVLITVN